MNQIQQADQLVCKIQVSDIEEVSDFFLALGASKTPKSPEASARSVTLKVGEGFIALSPSTDDQYFYPEMSVQMNSSEPSNWVDRLRNLTNTEQDSSAELDVMSPSGPLFSFRNKLIKLKSQSESLTTIQGDGVVLHFQITWWAKKWLDDYGFLSNVLGLTTSRGRSGPEGSRIAFLRAANSGRSIVEIVDGLYDQHEGPELHWLISLVVDNAEIFHERMVSAGQHVSALGYTSWNAHSFTAKSPSGPLLFVYQERPNGTPGMVGQPAGLD